MNLKVPVGVLFDLDGTLLDTAPDLVGALNAVRASEGIEAAAVKDYRRYVSQGALGLLRAGMPAASDVQTDEWRQQFLDYYQAHLMQDSRPFGGVDEVLVRLERAAVPWGIVTNKPEYLTLPILEKLGWHRRSVCVICGDTLARSKPDPAPVMMACRLMRLAPQQVVMVGDDLRDLQAAHAAGVIPALVNYGYGSEEAMRNFQNNLLTFDRIEELLEVIPHLNDAGFDSHS